MAGYMGCLGSVRMFDNLDSPGHSFLADLEVGIQGFEYGGTAAGDTFVASDPNPLPLNNAGQWAPALPAEFVNPARVIPGSDMLVVRYVSPDSNPLVSPFSNSAQMFVAPPHDFIEGHILVATDCQKASVFQLTNVQDTGTGVNLVHSNAGLFDPGNSTAVWGAQQSYGLGSEVAALEVVAYYVGVGASSAPSLYELRLRRIDGQTSGFLPVELVEDVDTMQIRYGRDTNNDNQVDTWQSADGIATTDEWSQVISAEISLVLRSGEEYGTTRDSAVYNVARMEFNPVDDRRLRNVFTTTVALRNRVP
jgi:type IV pilus assembly protein PilW